MLKFRKLKIEDNKDIELLFRQLTSGPIKFNINAILRDKNCNCIVILDNKKVIGFGALVRFNIPSKGEVGMIEDIVIDENYRGKGLGRSMLQELISIAKKENVLHVDLTSKRIRIKARKLYESLGFVMRESDIFRLKL